MVLRVSVFARGCSHTCGVGRCVRVWVRSRCVVGVVMTMLGCATSSAPVGLTAVGLPSAGQLCNVSGEITEYSLTGHVSVGL